MVKRAFDILVASAGLVASAPLWLLFAAVIKLEDGGPVFFAQERVGQGGRRFRALKFRSMRPDAEALARSIAALTADRDLRQRMGAAGRARVLSEFSMERMRTAATALYREVAGERVFTTRPAPV